MGFNWDSFKNSEIIIVTKTKAAFETFYKEAFKKKIYFEYKKKDITKRHDVYKSDTCLLVIEKHLTVGNLRDFQNSKLKRVIVL